MLDSKDIEILLTFQAYPLATASFISEKINMSISGTIARINRLIDENGAFRSVFVDLDNKALDLEIHDFFFKVNTLKSLKILEDIFCYNHPYVSYRGRCNGYYSGLHLQFRIPKGGLKYLTEIAELLGKKGIIQSYEYVERVQDEKSVRIKSALSCWNSNDSTWNFNWEKWKKGFRNSKATSLKIDAENKSVLEQLDYTDIQLLAQLTMDGRTKNSTMMKNLGIKNDSGVKQKIGRKVTFLKENTIKDYHIVLNNTVFDLYQSVIFRGNCGIDIARKLRNYLVKNQKEYEKSLMEETEIPPDIAIFPFSGIFFITENGFIWYVSAPPKHLSDLTNFMLDICPQHNLFIVDQKYAQNYGLWDQTYDRKTKKWKMDKEFMIDNVMKEICNAI